MSVILVATVAMMAGGILAAGLSMVPRKERCRIHTQAGRRYNICVLHKSHDGTHIAADGHRYK